MNTVKTIVIVLVASLIGGFVGGSVGGNQSDNAGGTTNLDALTLDNGNLTLTNGNIVMTSGSITSTSGSNTFGTTTAERVITGGTVFSSSTLAAVGTLTEAQLLYYGSIVYTPNVSDVTLTLPASSTLTTFIPNAGDQAEIYFRNSTSTAGIDITFGGGVGTILEHASSTSDTNPSIGKGKGGYFKFWRSSTSTDVYVTLFPTN